MSPSPGENDHDVDSPAMARPCASRAVTRNFCTSPWRASTREGDSSSDATCAATTSTGTRTVASPERPVSVVRPAPVPTTIPSWSTRATAADADDQLMRSPARRSLVCE